MLLGHKTTTSIQSVRGEGVGAKVDYLPLQSRWDIYIFHAIIQQLSYNLENLELGRHIHAMVVLFYFHFAVSDFSPTWYRMNPIRTRSPNCCQPGGTENL